MKTVILLAGSLFFISSAMAQNKPACDTIYLKSETDIKKADPCVITAADYVLSKPLHGNTQAYHDSRAFILAWMEKTSDYTFSLNDKITAVCTDDNLLLFGVYTTCLAKAAVQLKKDFYPEALKLFVNYISNAENKVAQTSKVKKLIEDFKNNKTDKYLK